MLEVSKCWAVWADICDEDNIIKSITVELLLRCDHGSVQIKTQNITA